MPFVARVNDALLYRGSDGREAWVMISPGRPEVFIVTDIHAQGQPYNAGPFMGDDLHTINEMTEKLGPA